MLETTINGYKVMVFKTYNGTELYINNPQGDQIYAHKVSGNPIERAKEVISKQ